MHIGKLGQLGVLLDSRQANDLCRGARNPASVEALSFERIGVNHLVSISVKWTLHAKPCSMRKGAQKLALTLNVVEAWANCTATNRPLVTVNWTMDGDTFPLKAMYQMTEGPQPS